MSDLKSMNSSLDSKADYNTMTGTDEESYSENESGRKSADKPAAKKAKVNKNSDDYKKRRQRNNEAVRKSRERAKRNFAITEARVSKLREENRLLELKKDGKLKELNVLQELARSLKLPIDEDV